MDLGIAGKVALGDGVVQGPRPGGGRGAGGGREPGGDLRPKREGAPPDRVGHRRCGGRGARGRGRHHRSRRHRRGWWRETVDRFGALDILVANAGGPPPGGAFDITDEQIAAAVNANCHHVDPPGPGGSARHAVRRLGSHLLHHVLVHQAADAATWPCPTWPAPGCGPGRRPPRRTCSPPGSPSTWSAQAVTPPTG